MGCGSADTGGSEGHLRAEFGGEFIWFQESSICWGGGGCTRLGAALRGVQTIWKSREEPWTGSQTDLPASELGGGRGGSRVGRRAGGQRRCVREAWASGGSPSARLGCEATGQLTQSSAGGQEHREGEERVRNPAGPLSSCVALGMLLNLSEPY